MPRTLLVRGKTSEINWCGDPNRDRAEQSKFFMSRTASSPWPLIAFLLAFAGIVHPMHSGQELALQEVLSRHAKAIGGPDALRGVRALRITLTIVEPRSRFDAVYVADRDMHMRIDILLGGKRLYTEAFDGVNGWQMGENPGSLKNETTEGSATLRRGILTADRFFSLQELAAKGCDLSLAPRQRIDGVDFYVIHQFLEGAATDLFVDPESWLITRTRETRAIHPDRDPTPQTTETVYSDFRNVAGVARAFKSVRTDLKSGAVVQTETLANIETNPVIDPAFFTRPRVEK